MVLAKFRALLSIPAPGDGGVLDCRAALRAAEPGAAPTAFLALLYSKVQSDPQLDGCGGGPVEAGLDLLPSLFGWGAV